MQEHTEILKIICFTYKSVFKLKTLRANVKKKVIFKIMINYSHFCQGVQREMPKCHFLLLFNRHFMQRTYNL